MGGTTPSEFGGGRRDPDSDSRRRAGCPIPWKASARSQRGDHRYRFYLLELSLYSLSHDPFPFWCLQRERSLGMTAWTLVCWAGPWVCWRQRLSKEQREAWWGRETAALRSMRRQRTDSSRRPEGRSRSSTVARWTFRMSGNWGGGTDDNPRSYRYSERDWVTSRGPYDDQAVRRVLWQRVLQRPWRTLFHDEYFAWSTTGVRNPRASTAILGLFLFAFAALVVPLFLVFLAVASQVFVLTMVLGVPLLLMGAASLFGVAGLLCAGGLALTTAVMMPMLALGGASQGLLWPALGMASIGSIWWVSRQRQARLDRVMETRSESSAQASASAEPSPDEEYLQRAREDLAQFDARLFGSSSPEVPTRTRETFQNPFRLGLGSEPPMNIWGVRRDQVERWNEQEVARAAQSFGLPSRICKWLARELVDGRVVLALTDAEQQELVSSVRPRLTFGERKLLRDFLRYLSRSI